MPTLTVTEKEHWKERIERRIDQKIEQLWCGTPLLKEQIEQASRERALRSLGIAELVAEQESIERAQAELESRAEQNCRTLLAVVRGVSLDKVGRIVDYRATCEIENAIQRRQTVHEQELLAEHEQGYAIARLRQERDNLLDTVWLATSPTQIRTLWTKVAELLHDEPTPLQREALAIPSLTES